MSTELPTALPEPVDMGLSVKWATCNVGANTPEEYGNYYAWGETSTKSNYDEDNCKTWKRRMSDIRGNSSYDAARANWGSNWRLPTASEFEELIDNCDYQWTTQNGVKGVRFTSKRNGNSIFFPVHNSGMLIQRWYQRALTKSLLPIPDNGLSTQNGTVIR